MSKNITHELMDRMPHINFKVYTATVIVVLQSKLTLAARVSFGGEGGIHMPLKDVRPPSQKAVMNESVSLACKTTSDTSMHSSD